ncbi:MAG: flagellar biosynthesis protein FlhB [Candidatus Hydrogenedentes bacterium]|nr:flagellar biosynthesis protein FlhB [Candidatus Hydrogenedentota bacterium]
MAEQSGGEKSLPASPMKRQRQREQGNVSKSQDLSAAVTLLAALLALRWFGPGSFNGMLDATRHYLQDINSIPVEIETVQWLALDMSLRLAVCSLPIILFLLLGGTAVNLAQVGFLFTVHPLTPKFDRINPISGMKKFFSLRSLVELIKSVLKLTLVSYIVWGAFRDRWPELVLLMQLPPMAIAVAISGLVYSAWLRVVIAMLILGILDYGYQRWQYEQDLRMTVQEAREEAKEMEGDPRIRQRVRQIQRQMAMQRMMKDVPKADVIITNPTTYAVALRYNMSEMAAPVVIAKGARLLAQRIRELAVLHDVPIVEKPELARALYRSIEVGRTIPEDLFRAVAEVLAFVYQIDRRAEKIRERAHTQEPAAAAV